MRRTMTGAFAPTVALLCSLCLASCATNPVPKAGTRVTSTSEIFRQTARDLAGQCDQMGGCTCFLDGIRTTCSLVFACLDAGFCELAPL